MKKKRVILWSVLALFLVLIAAGIIYVSSYIEGYDDRIASVTISDVDVSKVADGTYSGSYDLFPVSVVVKVVVKDHRIEDVELLKHVNGQGRAAEVLPEKVIEAQSLHVDTIAGATASSKTILKAIENALKR